ncbi:hypothetical protein pb186bvf_014801 [Paramecium bursaria]
MSLRQRYLNDQNFRYQFKKEYDQLEICIINCLLSLRIGIKTRWNFIKVTYIIQFDDHTCMISICFSHINVNFIYDYPQLKQLTYYSSQNQQSGFIQTAEEKKNYLLFWCQKIIIYNQQEHTLKKQIICCAKFIF